MDDKLSPLAKQQLVSTFLNVALGETVDSANQFLNTKKWCLEDALELYYTENADVVGPPCLLPEADDGATIDISPTIKIATVSTQGSSNSFLDPSEFYQRRQRRTHVQIAADALAGISTSTSTEFITCRRKRNSVKASAGVSGNKSSTLERLPPRIMKRRRRRTPAEITADFADGITTPTSKEMGKEASTSIPHVTRQRIPFEVNDEITLAHVFRKIRRTRLEIDGECALPGVMEQANISSASHPPCIPIGLGESGWHQGLKQVPVCSAIPCNATTFPLSHNRMQSAETLISSESAASNAHPLESGKVVSCRQYYCYRFQIRIGNFLIHTARVFLQYIVDMYVQVENTRLDFIHRNQVLIRSELYQGIVDSVNDGSCRASDIGHRVVLPASFLGGPRDMKCRYLNAMALVQKFGKPDLFLTITCNPNWPEIKEQLLPGEGSEYRPDLVARISHAKVRLLKKLILKDNIFSPVAASVDVIEFQKRGLPHLHMLLIFASGSKIVATDSFD